MKSNTRIALGCLATLAIPALVIVLLVTGLWVKAFNDARIAQNLTVWGAVQKWRAESKAEAERDHKERHMTEAEKDWQEASEAKLLGNPAAARYARLKRETAQRAKDNEIGLVGIAQLILFGGATYFVPSFVALARKHPQQIAIIALNVLLGWTVIGWMGALIWALVKTPPLKPMAG